MGFDLIQIAPELYLPESLQVSIGLARSKGETYGRSDLAAATVGVQLLVPDRGIFIEGGTLNLVERGSRGRREVVQDATIALALRSVMDRIVSCEEHGWRLDDGGWPIWEPALVPRQDRALRRIKQRMQPDWPDRNGKVLLAAAIVNEAHDEQRPAKEAVARELYVSERQADVLIREAKDAGYLGENPQTPPTMGWAGLTQLPLN